MLITQLLDWLRAVLFGPRTSGRHSRRAVTPVAPRRVQFPLSPCVLGARLVTVRRLHLKGRPTPPQARTQSIRDWEAEEAWEPTGVLVRPYVAHLGVSAGNNRADAQAWAGPWAHPWGDAR